MAQTGETAVTDVLIIGGSHAGLSAALTLYRSLNRTIIFDSKKPRNSYSTAVRLVSTWDNKSPETLKAASRKELLTSGLTRFVDAQVQTVKIMDNELFEVTDENGDTWLGKKILFATGTGDIFPNLRGYEELYARGIFPCMFQFGYEYRGSPSAGLLAVDGLENVMQAKVLAKDGRKFAKTFTIYTNDNTALADQILAEVDIDELSVDNRKITHLQKDSESGIVIEFGDGSRKRETFLVHRPLTQLDRRLTDQLGLDLTQTGDVAVVPPFCKTNVPGVYAAGDCASPAKSIPNAMNMGAYAGCGLARELA